VGQDTDILGVGGYYEMEKGFSLVLEHVRAYRELFSDIGRAIDTHAQISRETPLRCLFLGCGSGFGITAVREVLSLSQGSEPAIKYYGIEIDKESARAAGRREQGIEEKHKRARIIVGDVHSLGTLWREGAADVIVACNLLYLTNAEVVIQGVVQALKPGGLFVMTEPLDTASMMKIVFGEFGLRWEESGSSGVLGLGLSLAKNGRALASAIKYNSRVTSGTGVRKESRAGWEGLLVDAGLVVVSSGALATMKAF